jgi:hypothetical protein
MFRKQNKRHDLRRIYRTIETIHDARSPREADILTGYAIGIIDEMLTRRKITKATANALVDMVQIIGDDVHGNLKRKEDPKAAADQILDFDEMTEESDIDA